METADKSAVRQIVPVRPQALAVRSAELVRRGLRDLARDSSWMVRRAFADDSSHLAISPTGLICAVPSGPPGEMRPVVLCDLESSASSMVLSAPGESPSARETCEAVFAWAPDGARLVAASSMWPAALHLFDVNKKTLLETFRGDKVMPSAIAWSRSSRYLAVATAGAASSLGIWEARTGELNFADSPSCELGAPAWIERQTYEAEFGEEGAFRGYARTTFSPDERWLSSVVEFHGEWADDSIAFVDVPAMGQQQSHPAHGHITDLSWTHDSAAMLYCAAGAAYRVPLDSMEAQELPFGAELCACHPHLPLCVCFSSWLKNSAKGRLFLVDLQHMTVFDEYAADGVADLCWSADGTKAYAVTRDGRAFIYEPAIL